MRSGDVAGSALDGPGIDGRSRERDGGFRETRRRGGGCGATSMPQLGALTVGHGAWSDSSCNEEDKAHQHVVNCLAVT